MYLPCLPILGIAAADNGYCYGCGDTTPPSVAELVEQFARFSVCVALLLSVPGMTAAWAAAVPPFATFVGELMAALVVAYMLRRRISAVRALPGRVSATLTKRIWKLAAPMTWMRVSGTLMRTANAVIIPLRLRVSGLSAQEATARLGMFSGMAMPLVMLPSVVTGALAMVAGPALARHERDSRALRRILFRVLPAALIVSSLAAAALALSAPWIAHRLYRQPDLAMLLVEIAPLVPVMGVQQVCGGMLAGLGLQRSALASSLAGALITLALNFLLVPDLRLTGSAIAHIAGMGATLALNLRVLLRAVRRDPLAIRPGALPHPNQSA